MGYLLAGVPGVELMTLVACLAGVALGPARGALAGAVAEAIYSVGSPYGVAAPPLLIAQVLGMALPGLLGGLAGPLLATGAGRLRGMLLGGILGAASALGFDLLTNLGVIAGYGLDWRVVLAGAAVMGAVHLAVNVAIFASLLPALAPRMALLGRGALRGGPTAALALALLCAVPGAAGAQEPAAADTAAVPVPVAAPDAAPAPDAPGRMAPAPPPEGPAALGWKRETWTPFTLHNLDALDWWSPRVTVVEAGVAGPAMVLGEAVTAPSPLVTVDGVPWGTGHALADDPWLVPRQGLRDGTGSWFADGLGGTAGRLDLVTADPDPARAVSTYRGVKGRHESYMRSLEILTADAPWRVGFAFEEVLDNEAFNFTDLPDEEFRPDASFFPGHGKVRQSRTRLQRRLDADNRLSVDFFTGRLTRNRVPAWDADQREIWDTGVAVTAEGRGDALAWRSVVHWRDRDVQWGNTALGGGGMVAPRKVETGREGVLLELRPAARPAAADSLRGAAPARPPLSVVRLAYHQWSVADRSDTVEVRPPDMGPVQGRGRQVRLEAGSGRRFAGQRLTVGASAAWDERIDIAPGWSAALQEDAERPRWRLELAGDGRAPRSDELLTPSARYILDRRLTILPNDDLERERTVRAGLLLRWRLLGTDLALDASVRRLRDGITWAPLPGETTTGRWSNDLELDSTRLTAGLERQGRLLGWGRALLEGTWQSFTEHEGRAALLPPRRSGRLALFWENHFFQEDGILQLGLIGLWRGEMDDPWDVTRSFRLPARTTVDLLVGFRLVGAHLSLNFRNLTGDRSLLSAGTRSAGQQTDLRLMWSFRH